jgi:hypothetical protein
LTCTDINECAKNSTLCFIPGQVCENTPASYKCLCPTPSQLVNGSCRGNSRLLCHLVIFVS